MLYYISLMLVLEISHPGFVLVLDVDECADGSHNCDANAACTNTQGEFACDCDYGYEGDGTTCHGKIICIAFYVH